ncbi:FAD/FMN-dependent dehydrogenase [Bradyrhizobium sp. YR681]|uniref:FAD-linked oxidase C-terminal domain-containing protein n=1 Tax=Bradyrhizobium sp. YR681 TaxID=1144344 RepID=UPI00026F97AE|nr:FAD-linked oxidase C-terminal domain-containing protein [Bradyrhizobium sp. YR681]EJN10600.1 FAD/FMN-dependent dehydrogenase [Bradyrhizobium sp. YR681]
MGPRVSTSILADRLTGMIGPRASVARGVLDQHGQSESHYQSLPPDIVVFPETTQEVAEIVKLCAAAGMPIVPFGAGTSLEGNAAAVAGGVCFDFARMNKVLNVHDSDMDVVVQPGITRKQLNAELRGTGLFFPIDPGADASIGGMTSTRASGTMAVRYGTMKDNVMALEVVLADGRIIRTAQRARKSAAGYDLTRMFVGAEGTLGLITEITLKVHPVPQAISAAVCSFDTLHNAVDTAISVIQSAIPVARIELVDDVMMRGINAYARLGYREAPTLFFEFHGSGASVAEQAEAAEAIAADHGGHGFAWAKAQEDRSRLWHARDNTLYAGLGLRPGARAVITDVCVPISRLAECLTETRRDADEQGLTAPIVGHVGDGNFHMLILIDPARPEEAEGAKALQARMVARAIAMDGTCTGEHGIGLGKIDYLTNELGEAVDVMRSIKTALDPNGLMNPGKIFASGAKS